MLRPLLALKRSRSRSIAPRLEALESRQLLAARPAAQVSFVETPDGTGTATLQVVGTTRNDSIVMIDDGRHAAGSLRITANGTQLYSNLLPLSTVNIATRTGNDRVLYELRNDLIAGPSQTITVSSASTITPSIKGGGNLQVTANLLGSIQAGGSLTLIAAPDRKGATTLNVDHTGVVNGDLIVAVASPNSSATPRTGPVTFNLTSTATIGAGGSFVAGAVGGAARNLMNLNYIGTNNGDISVVGIGAGKKDLLTASVQMAPGSTGTVGKGTPAQLTATGALAQVRFGIVRGADSASKLGVNAFLSTASRRSVSIHTANVSALAAGKDSLVG